MTASPNTKMDAHRNTPPQSRPSTPKLESFNTAAPDYPSPTSTSSPTPDATPQKPTIPTNPTQATINADPILKRFQQDLLVLTSFNDNTTLHWRPPWFAHHPSTTSSFWTIHNPPNVVTEILPHPHLGRPVYTRRMRREGDRSALYIQTWEQWERYCGLGGVPRDFLCEGQVRLMRGGLGRGGDGEVCAAPNYPLYPEPQSVGMGGYLLDEAVYGTHLPKKFYGLEGVGAGRKAQGVVVHADGALKVESREDYFRHVGQRTRCNGRGEYVDEGNVVGDVTALRDQSRSMRWTYLPWTKEQEGSCGGEERDEIGAGKRVLKLKLRLWNTAAKRGGDELEEPQTPKRSRSK